MSARSLNKVILIGNITRDPNLRYTPNNTAVCSFGLATNRTWTPADGGEKQEKVEYHNVVAWAKLAEICGQLLHKGDKVYVEGRLQTRDWKADDGTQRRITEVVIENMILLRQAGGDRVQMNDEDAGEVEESRPRGGKRARREEPESEVLTDEVTETEDVSDDIPF